MPVQTKTLHVFSPSSHHLSPPPSSPSEAHFAIQQSLALSSSASSSASGDVLTVPSLDSLSPLGAQAEGETEVTVKLFLPRSTSSSSRSGKDVAESALQALGELTGSTRAVDQLVVGFADVVYEGEETDFSGRTKVRPQEPVVQEEKEGGCGGLKLQSRKESELARKADHGLSDQRLDELVEFWEVRPALHYSALFDLARRS